eukprot:s813_g23.t1
MFCIKPSWRQHTSLMIVVHVLGLLYGFGVMARHLVGNIMSLEAYSGRWEQSIEHLIRPFWAITFDATNLLLFTGRLCAGGSWKQMDYVRAHQINMQLLTAVAVDPAALRPLQVASDAKVQPRRRMKDGSTQYFDISSPKEPVREQEKAAGGKALAPL